MQRSTRRKKSKRSSRIISNKYREAWRLIQKFLFKMAKHLGGVLLISALDKISNGILKKMSASAFGDVSDRFNHSVRSGDERVAREDPSQGRSYSAHYSQQGSSNSSFPGFGAR